MKDELTKEHIDRMNEIICDVVLTSLELFLMGYKREDEYYQNEMKKVMDKY
jgi:hypothetical protein